MTSELEQRRKEGYEYFVPGKLYKTNDNIVIRLVKSNQKQQKKYLLEKDQIVLYVKSIYKPGFEPVVKFLHGENL